MVEWFPGVATARFTCGIQCEGWRFLVCRLYGHPSWVKCFTELPGGLLASGADDASIRVWDLAQPNKAINSEGHDGHVTSIASRLDGTAVSGGDDGTIRVWDVAHGTEIKCLAGYADFIFDIGILPDGRIVFCDEDLIGILDVDSGEVSSLISAPPFSFSGLAVSQNGKVMSCGNDGSIRIWDLARGTETACLKGHTAGIGQVVSLPDDRLVSGGLDGTIRVWDILRGVEVSCINANTQRVECVAVLADGRIVTGGDDGRVRVWDLTRRVETLQLTIDTTEGHRSSIDSVAIMPDGHVVSGGYDGTVRVWDLAQGSTIARLTFDAPVDALTVTPDGVIIVGDGFGRLHMATLVA